MENEEEGVPLQLSKPVPCSCTSLLSQAAKFRGIRCQELFRQAFVLAGQEEAISRATFACFVRCGKAEALLPRLVKMYCETSEMAEGIQSEVENNFCLGCTVNPKVEGGIHFAYQFGFPEVTEEFLRVLAKTNEPFHLSDEHVLQLFISNIPEEEEWFDLIRQDDFE